MPARPPNPAAPALRGIGPGGSYRTLRPMVAANSPWQPASPATLTTVRYVRKTGSDSNGGTSPADAWLTINKALTTAAPGTVIYVGAGTYREIVTVTITPTGPLPVALIGDVDGSYTGDAGPVIWTAYLTNDKTAPSASTVLTMNGKSFLTFKNIMFVGGTAGQSCVDASALTSQGITFSQCAFLHGTGTASNTFSLVTPFGVPLNWVVDRCYFAGSTRAINISLTNGVGPDFDANVAITNCMFVGYTTHTVRVTSSGAGAALGGGVRIRNCTFIFPNAAFQTETISTKVPCTITNSFIYQAVTALNASGSAGSQVEDYNLIIATTPRAGVTAGVHSVSNGSYAPLFHFGQEAAVWGAMLRPYGEPMISSPLLAFGNDGAQIPYDLRGGPRPTGLLVPAVGALERGNNFVKETGTVHTGTNAISCVGDGFQDFDLPVDAGTRTISVYCQVDSNYTGPPARLQVLPNQEIGVGDPHDEAEAGAVGAFEQLAVAINPTGSGIVTVRVISSDVSGIAKTIFDTFAVT